ncbi:WD repeat-containing protein 34-like [Cimex lectularius]|uniref:WD repeat-containing protein 34 n=1 Tax=Cimex lectularius TaxID=79782 RepID=A0A8I6TD91_CIMLE|nr:WD repeat-containing protein 34-like [Cimex lectularius]
MFSNYTSEAVGFDSISEGSTETLDSSCQTSECFTSEKENQTFYKNTLEVQTDVFNREAESPAYDEQELTTFLKRVCPAVIRELDRVEKTKAFSNYKLTEEDHHDEVKLMHVLSASHLPALPKLRVSCMAWNCTGAIIGLAFETPVHSDWCVHDSAIYFYNINKYKFDGFQPNRVITTASCVTALAMHPFEPAVVAAGTQAGEVHVWSLLNEGPESGFTNIVTHNDRVTKIEWVSIKDQLLLVTSSLDSYMFTFKVVSGLRSVTLNDKFVLNEDDKVIKAGVTTFGFSKSPGVFVAGLEGGELLHCSAFGATPMAKRPDSASTFKKPVLKSLGKLLGPVVTIEFSPYHENLFVTAHTENKFTIRSIDQVTPLREIYTDFEVVGTCWSPSQGNAVLSWGASDKIVIFNSDNGKKLIELRPEDEPDYELSKEPRPVIYNVAFNVKYDNILALSCHNSKSYIWEIPKFYKAV